MKKEPFPAIIEFRHKLREFYAKHSRLVQIILRFVLVLVTLYYVNGSIGYMEMASSPLVTLITAVVCAFIPWGAAAFVMALVVIANLSSLSFMAMLFFVILMVIIYCLYYIFQPGASAVLIFVPLLFYLNIPFAAPILIGLTCSLAGILPMCIGTVLFYFLSWIAMNSTMLESTSVMDAAQQLNSMVNVLIGNTRMNGIMITFAVTALVVYLNRKLPVRYSRYIAIGIGALVSVVVSIILDVYLDLGISFEWVLAGTLIGAGAGLLMTFFVFAGDYRSMVETEFEDDEYYYYVKAVPKMDVNPEEKQVKRFVTRPQEQHNADRDRLAVYLGYEPEIDTGVFDDEDDAPREDEPEMVTVALDISEEEASKIENPQPIGPVPGVSGKEPEKKRYFNDYAEDPADPDAGDMEGLTAEYGHAGEEFGDPGSDADAGDLFEDIRRED